jgi:hypothetical protein
VTANGPVPFRPGQVGGKQATEALQSLLAVGDEVVAECYELDAYGRSVCHVFKGSMNINLEMIKTGWGWLPECREWIRDQASFAAEQTAKSADLGAWGLVGAGLALGLAQSVLAQWAVRRRGELARSALEVVVLLRIAPASRLPPPRS